MHASWHTSVCMHSFLYHDGQGSLLAGRVRFVDTPKKKMKTRVCMVFVQPQHAPWHMLVTTPSQPLHSNPPLPSTPQGVRPNHHAALLAPHRPANLPLHNPKHHPPKHQAPCHPPSIQHTRHPHACKCHRPWCVVHNRGGVGCTGVDSVWLAQGGVGAQWRTQPSQGGARPRLCCSGTHHVQYGVGMPCIHTLCITAFVCPVYTPCGVAHSPCGVVHCDELLQSLLCTYIHHAHVCPITHHSTFPPVTSNRIQHMPMYMMHVYSCSNSTPLCLQLTETRLGATWHCNWQLD